MPVRLTTLIALGAFAVTIAGGVVTGIYLTGYTKGRTDCELAQAAADAAAVAEKIEKAREIAEEDAAVAGADAAADAKDKVIIDAIPANDAACLDAAAADRLRQIQDR